MKAKTITNRNFESKEHRIARVVETRNANIPLSDQIARHKTLVYMNELWPGCKLAYPDNPAMWRCDKFYPDAEGGPLYVDEPQIEWEIIQCKEKAKKLHNLGVRYVYLTPRMSLEEAKNALGNRS